jgi:hypothetical protein
MAVRAVSTAAVRSGAPGPASGLAVAVPDADAAVGVGVPAPGVAVGDVEVSAVSYHTTVWSTVLTRAAAASWQARERATVGSGVFGLEVDAPGVEHPETTTARSMSAAIPHRIRITQPA